MVIAFLVFLFVLLLFLLFQFLNLILGLNQSIVAIWNFPENNGEDHCVHEDYDEMELEKHHGS